MKSELPRSEERRLGLSIAAFTLLRTGRAPFTKPCRLSRAQPTRLSQSDPVIKLAELGMIATFKSCLKGLDVIRLGFTTALTAFVRKEHD